MTGKTASHTLQALLIAVFISFLCVGCTDDPRNPQSDVLQADTVKNTDDVNDEPAETSPLVRTTLYGQLRGVETANGAYAWLGVPFAEPPVGDLRWRTPRAPQPWEGIRSAETFCSYCPQYGNLISETGRDTFGKLTGNEDCLYLNIWRPATDEAGLPVFVFIYGGGNYIGRSDLTLYDGANFATESNMIFITLNYRLGVLGWFSHPALETGDALDDSGNYGTLDIIKALEWVQDNIEAFGGDPDNVTLSGQSSGAINVYAMLTSPLASGFFHRAVAMSGFPLSCTRDFAEARSGRILDRLLRQDDHTLKDGYVCDAEGSVVSDSIASYMRSRTLEDLFNPDYAMFTGLPTDGGVLSTMLRMGTTVDGVVIPRNMMESLETEQYNKVPLILGNTTEEIKLFLPLLLAGDQALFDMFETFDPNNPDLRILDVLKPGLWPVLPLYDPMSNMVKRIFQNFGVDRTADVLSRYQNVYVYQFAWNDEPEPFDFYIGAGHAVDVAFPFGNFITDRYSLMNFAWSEENKTDRDALSGDMMTYYAQFARTGTPNADDDGPAAWPSWDSALEEKPRMIFDAGGGYVLNAPAEIEDFPDVREMMEVIADYVNGQ